MNSLTQTPIEGAQVTVYFIGDIPQLVQTSSYTIKTIDTVTDENGRYFTGPWIGPPKGLFQSRRTHARAIKSGFVHSRDLRYRTRPDPIYLVPEAEAVLEEMRSEWRSAENSRIPPMIRRSVSDDDSAFRIQQYVRAYDMARKIAKTDREVRFLAELCDRVLKAYEEITWTEKLEQERVKRCGDRCSYETLQKCKLEGKRGR